jgi:2'-5' RNA ligase
MRCFVGIGLGARVAEALEALRRGLPVGRLVAQDALHLTLAFLDELEPWQIEALHEELAGLRPAPVVLRFGGLELFGAEKPRLLALAVAPDPALIALQRAVAQAARQAGIAQERRRFRPHVTLARFRARLEPGEACRLAQWLEARPTPEIAPMQVAEFTLFSSELRPEGPRYRALAAYRLPDASSAF